MTDYILGIDIGGTNTKYGLVDRKGNVVNEGAFATHAHEKIEIFLKELKKHVLPKLEGKSVKGVGIGAPNANYFDGTIKQAANIVWGDDVPLKKLIEDLLGLPAVLTNDANAAAMGEMKFGGAQGMKNFVVFTLGTGLGSGLVVDGKVVYGHSGFAGEIGHVSVNPDGRYCGCGRRGCLETYVSATGIKKTVFKMMADYTRPSVLRDVSYNAMSAEMITNAAKDHDYIAIKAFEYTGQIFGQKLADTVVHSSPEAIFLFGGLVNAGDYLMDPATYYMEKFMFKPFKKSVKLVPSSLMDRNAAVLGAAALGWEEIDKDKVIA
ncbi:ROK family protein [Reichenbachiella carrageenanivorans]|uniref:ROK family protein n=1 Tax=Reichenbachiella carrageenanivorans TaxID=2979869 RepID=A0ABY6CYS2_9BACT|nr:ROK family protein [Reichenbachiella carrageenanivorans]UXX77968.1 ROK family protein [Reichenbachiella carrageenanivorans]